MTHFKRTINCGRVFVAGCNKRRPSNETM